MSSPINVSSFYSESLFGNPRAGSCDNILVIERLINIKQFCSIQFQLILHRSRLNTCSDVPDVSSLEISPKSTKLANNLLEIFIILKIRVELNFNPSKFYFQ